MFEVAVVQGDGIGREVAPAAQRVIESLDVEVEFIQLKAGDEVFERTGTPLPERTRTVVGNADATLLGATGETSFDVHIPLRREVGSFVNIRPATAYPGVSAIQPQTDLVVLRENTEGVYAGFESRLTDDVATLTRLTTKSASRRLATFACEYAQERGIDEITLAHKDNVMRETDGLFRETVEAVAANYGIETDSQYIDALAMYLVMEPERFDVIVTPNLAGDVLSELTSGLVGGVGLLPSANVGRDNGIFEPIHGCAPDIAGEGIANPVAMFFSAAMMLEFLDEDVEAGRIRDATVETLAKGPHTPDLGGDANMNEVTDTVIDRI